MKKYFCILLVFFNGNCDAMNSGSGLKKGRLSIPRPLQADIGSAQEAQLELDVKEKEVFMTYVVAPIATFVAAAAVFNAYKDL